MLRITTQSHETKYPNIFSRETETKIIPLNHPCNDGFISSFLEVSPKLFVFRFLDRAHFLSCELTLELTDGFAHLDDQLEEENYISSLVACGFPLIDRQRLRNKVQGDAYLVGMILVKFQLKILEELLLFADDKNAYQLILIFHESNLDYLEIYQQFLVAGEDMIRVKGEETEIVIPSNLETYEEVVDFDENVDKKFRQTLWHDQKVNPAFRQYLRSVSLFEF